MEEFKIDPERLESAKQMFRYSLTLLAANDVDYDERLIYRILREGIRAILLLEDFELYWDGLEDDVKDVCDEMHAEVGDLLGWNDIRIKHFLSDNYFPPVYEENEEEDES